MNPGGRSRRLGAGGHHGRARLSSGVRSGWYPDTGKRVLDVALVLLTAPLTVPVMVLFGLALWIESGFPLYRQERLGRGGRRFHIWKLRTMVRDADELLEHYLSVDPALQQEWERTQKLKNDPRVTRVGALLRITSLDELPQLWNVLRGDMSLVGPRPMMPEQLGLYGDTRAYFAVRPGITGLWQISARNESVFSYRATVDAAYCASMSLPGDLSILFRTAGVVLRRTGY